MASNFSKQCLEILELLSVSHNVLLSGPPGTGKSRLLGEIASAFSQGIGTHIVPSSPVHNPVAAVPIPPVTSKSVNPLLAQVMPSPDRTARAIFRTVFDQNYKHLDFVTGMMPSVKKVAGKADFEIIPGTLYRASEYAKRSDGAALLIIDEINRGPAVQIFGGSIVAIESDKRLSPDGSVSAETQWFEIQNPADGERLEYALPHHLFIIAAMNQADASVEPLDVAFLRRWEPYKLIPDIDVLKQHFAVELSSSLPATPTRPQHVFIASILAWKKVNERISLGRGAEFQIGHGVLMSYGDPVLMDLAKALSVTAKGWAKVRAHVEEVFFGDVRGIATTLNAVNGPSFHPLQLHETTFADDIRLELNGPAMLGTTAIYNALRAIAL